MTITLSTKGQIVIPKEIRVRKGLRVGDELEIEEGADFFLLRKRKRNAGLVRHLQACPVQDFKTPKMQGNLSPAKF